MSKVQLTTIGLVLVLILGLVWTFPPAGLLHIKIILTVIVAVELGMVGIIARSRREYKGG